MSETTPLAWTRYCVPRGETAVMRNGFVVAPGETPRDDFFALVSGTVAANVVPFANLDAVPCVVLLGDMGLGKSTVLRAEFERMQTAEASPDHAFLWIDLRGQSERTIERRIFDHTAFQGWLRGEMALTIYLDSLDECWRRVHELTEVLVTGFEVNRSAQVRPLRLRLACRAGEWHSDLEARLRDVFPADSNRDGATIRVVTLASLSERDVRTAAYDREVNAERFLDEVHQLNLEPLAGQPLTLFFLLDEHREHGGLPPSRVELYQRGCLRLCADLHAQVGAAHRRTNAEERLRIAQRVAAASILGNRLLLNTNFDAPGDNPAVLEMTPFVGAGTVSREAVNETLYSALFSEANDGLQTWRHLSYAEFLTAEELVDRDLSVDALIDLVTLEEGGRRLIPPQLEETVCWLVEMSPGLFARLVADNPTALLRCNQRWFSAAQKRQLLDSLLTALRAHATPMDDFSEGRWVKLQHPDLAEQLRPLCLNPAEALHVREAALDLVGRCVPQALLSECVELFADVRVPYRIRASAAAVLLRTELAMTAMLVREQIPPNAVKDWNVELKGMYLRIVWPHQLAFSELVPLLAPARRGIHGTNEGFLEHFAEKMPAGSLVEALAWLRSGSQLLPAEAVQTLMRQAFARLGEPEVCRLVVDLFAGAADGEDFFGDDTAGRWTADLSANHRRALWTELLARGIDWGEITFKLRLEETGILHEDDAPWFAAQLREAGTEEARKSALWALRRTFDRERRDHWDAIWPLAGMPEIDRLIARYHASPVPDKTEARPVGRPRPPAVPRGLKIDASLSAFAEGKILAAAAIYDHLLADQTIHPPGDLTSAPGWAEITAEQRGRVLAAGLEFLRQFQPGTPDFAERRVSTAMLAGIHFALVHQQLAPATLDTVSATAWGVWFPVFIGAEEFAQVDGQPGWAAVLARAWDADSASALAHVRRLFASSGGKNFPQILFRLPQVPLAEVESLCFAYLDATKTPAAVRSLHELLTVRGSVRWQRWLEEKSRAVGDEYHFIARALVFEGSAAAMEAVFVRMEQDASWGREFIRTVAWRHQWPHWLPLVSAARLFWLWRWIGSHLRPAEIENAREQQHNVLELENAVFGEFRSRHSDEAIATLEAHLLATPESAYWLNDVLVQMRRNRRQAIWVPCEPSALLSFLDHPVYPPIRSTADLIRCVQIALDRFEASFHGETASTELWNKVPVGHHHEWSPKDELEISNAAKRFLERELQPMRVRVLREVELRPMLGAEPAQETDLFVIAPPVRPEEKLELVVEVKGTWNRSLLTDLQGQLIDRYLRPHSISHGLYVAFHFVGDGWNRPGDGRKRQSLAHRTLEEVRAALDGQLAAAQLHGKIVAVRVIDARLN